MKYLYYYFYVCAAGDAIIVPFSGVQTCPDGEKPINFVRFVHFFEGHFSATYDCRIGYKMSGSVRWTSMVFIAPWG